MNWDAVVFFGMISAGWAFAIMLGMQLGIRVERWRRDKEVDAFEFPEDDSAYWKRTYEELAEEYDALRDDFNHAVGPKSFGKELGRKDARGGSK